MTPPLSPSDHSRLVHWLTWAAPIGFLLALAPAVYWGVRGRYPGWQLGLVDIALLVFFGALAVIALLDELSEELDVRVADDEWWEGGGGAGEALLPSGGGPNGTRDRRT